MKKFDLQEYIKNPSRKVVTRDGKSVRILCTDAKGPYPIAALVRNEDNEDSACIFKEDGTFLEGSKSSHDLFFDVETKHGWVNLYRLERGFLVFGSVFDTKEDALDELKRTDSACKYIDTIQIEWEE